VKLLAFGDLHLGAGTALGREPGDRLRDQEQVLERIVSLAGVRQVDAILMGGDLFEGPGITPEQLDAFMRPFEQLEGSIPMVAVSGNGRHDLAMRHVNALQPLRHVPGVHVYSRPTLYELGPVMVACLPWVSPARLVASMNGNVDRDQVNEHAARLLVKVARDLREAAGDKPAILLTHGSISGAALPNGLPVDQLREPILDLFELADLGFAAVIAAHIHKHQVLHDEPLIAYVGSPMPLSFGETNDEHGVLLLDVAA
jgi:exonuclease SbcD